VSTLNIPWIKAIAPSALQFRHEAFLVLRHTPLIKMCQTHWWLLRDSTYATDSSVKFKLGLQGPEFEYRNMGRVKVTYRGHNLHTSPLCKTDTFMHAIRDKRSFIINFYLSFVIYRNVVHFQSSGSSILLYCFYPFVLYDMIFVNCNWVVTRWQ
jgi:hypothetical protein